MSILQLYDLFAVRHRWTFVAVFAATFAAAVAVTLALPEQYRADATLIVGENRPLATGATSVQLDEVLTRTYSALLETAAVERDVLKALPFEQDRGELAGKVVFEVDAGTRLIKIRAFDGDPERARQLADAYAVTFVAQQQRTAVEANRTQLDELAAEIGRLSFERRRLEGSTERPGIERLARVEAELEAARATYASTRQNAALQGSNVSVASRATVPTDPAKPRTKLFLALGLLFALVLAALAVLLRNAFDDRVHSEEEVTSLLGAPVLARVPLERSQRARGAATQESLDVLRTVLQMRGDRDASRILAVTGADTGDGKTEIVALLAAAYARAGSRVVAVDADLRRPALAGRLGTDDPGRGLTTALVERNRDPRDLVVATRRPGVALVPSGPLPPNPSVLLGLPRLHDVLEALRATYDVVLVDTPPSAVGADTMAVAAAVDGVLVVVDLRTLRRRRLRRLREELTRSATPLLGVVVNRVPGDRVGYDYRAVEPAPSGERAARRSGSAA